MNSRKLSLMYSNQNKEHLGRTLQEGKEASEKLKVVQEEMEDAASKGEDVSAFKQ